MTKLLATITLPYCLLIVNCGHGGAVDENCTAAFNARKYNLQKQLLPLVFYNNSVLSFICGFGIPVEDLEYEAVTSGFVFRAQYGLPNAPQKLRQGMPLNIRGRKLRQVQNYRQQATATSVAENIFEEFLTSKQSVFSQHRWALYRTMALLAEQRGLANGKACVLRSICESAAVSLHYGNGLLGDLLHIFLTPSSSRDALSSHRDNEYLHAELLGSNYKMIACAVKFGECQKSILAQFSHLFEVTLH